MLKILHKRKLYTYAFRQFYHVVIKGLSNWNKSSLATVLLNCQPHFIFCIKKCIFYILFQITCFNACTVWAFLCVYSVSLNESPLSYIQKYLHIPYYLSHFFFFFIFSFLFISLSLNKKVIKLFFHLHSFHSFLTFPF